MVELDGMYIVVFSIFASLALILLVMLIAVAFKIIETLKKVDAVIDDINGKAKKIDGVFDIVNSTSSFVTTFGNKISDFVIGIVQNVIDRKKGKEDL